MDEAKRRRLERAGFKTGTAAEFLGMSPEEAKLVELRAVLARAVRRRREAAGLTQTELAGRMKSSQSRVVKIETAAEGVSLDLMFRGLFAAGGGLADVLPPLPRPRRGRVREPKAG